MLAAPWSPPARPASSAATSLVNNGHHQGDFTPCLDSDLAAWPDVFAVNLYGPMHLIQAVVPMMRAQGDGSIINVNSGAVISSKPTLGAYSASKARLARSPRRWRSSSGATDPRQRDVRELDGR